MRYKPLTDPLTALYLEIVGNVRFMATNRKLEQETDSRKSWLEKRTHAILDIAYYHMKFGSPEISSSL